MVSLVGVVEAAFGVAQVRRELLAVVGGGAGLLLAVGVVVGGG